MDAFDVQREEGPGHGRFFITLDGTAEAEMTYRKIGDSVIVIEHTFTPPEYRGRNIAAMLMGKAIEAAESEGLKIVPQCSYVAAQFRRHPEWAGLLAQ